MEFKVRLKKARTEKNISQSELAKKIGVHVTNISRYERGENKPTSEVLNKLANALGITSDYLMDGSLDDKAQNIMTDKELLSQFQRVEKLPDDKKNIIKEVVEAFLLKVDLQQKLVHQ